MSEGTQFIRFDKSPLSNCSVMVTNLTKESTYHELEQIFSEHGLIYRLHIVRRFYKMVNGRSIKLEDDDPLVKDVGEDGDARNGIVKKHMAFIQYYIASAAKAAEYFLDGVTWYDCKVRVKQLELKTNEKRYPLSIHNWYVIVFVYLL